MNAPIRPATGDHFQLSCMAMIGLSPSTSLPESGESLISICMPLSWQSVLCKN